MSTHVPVATWVLAQIKPNAANIAEKNLKRQGFVTFLSQEEETGQRRGEFVGSVRPHLPGYIVASFDVRQGHWRAANSTSDITSLVKFGKSQRPSPSISFRSS